MATRERCYQLPSTFSFPRLVRDLKSPVITRHWAFLARGVNKISRLSLGNLPLPSGVLGFEIRIMDTLAPTFHQEVKWRKRVSTQVTIPCNFELRLLIDHFAVDKKVSA